MTRDEVFALVASAVAEETGRTGRRVDSIVVPIEWLRGILDEWRECAKDSQFQHARATSAYQQLGDAHMERKALAAEWLEAVRRVAQVCEALGVNYVTAEWSEIWKRLTELLKLEAEARKLKDNGKELKT